MRSSRPIGTGFTLIKDISDSKIDDEIQCFPQRSICGCEKKQLCDYMPRKRSQNVSKLFPKEFRFC